MQHTQGGGLSVQHKGWGCSACNTQGGGGGAQRATHAGGVLSVQHRGGGSAPGDEVGCNQTEAQVCVLV